MNKKNKTLIISLIVIIIIIAFAVFLLFNSENIINVLQGDKGHAPVTKQCTMFQEPYQVQVEKDLNYKIMDSNKGKHMNILGITGWIKIMNEDTEPGTFIINCNFDAAGTGYTASGRAYIYPGETKNIECKPSNVGLLDNVYFTYVLVPGTKTVTETKYKNVEKCE